MDSGWMRLTPQGRPQETVYVDLAKASSVWSLEQGSEIWFPASGCEGGVVRVNEPPDVVMAKLREAKDAERA